MSLAAQTHGFLSPTGVEITFLLVGLVTLGAALVTVTTRRLVHAALWLVVALGGLAVEYLLLTAEFIAWVQVLIYVGSVVVLLLFGLMLTRAPIGPSPDADSENRWVGLAVALAAAAALVWVVVDAFRTTYIDLDGAAQGTTEVTGQSLFRGWVLPFEALSVLLLAALVGAIVISRKNAEEEAGAGGTAPVTPPRRTGPRSTGNGRRGTTAAASAAARSRATATSATAPEDEPGPAAEASHSQAIGEEAPGKDEEAPGKGEEAAGKGEEKDEEGEQR
ncbi:NADH-quinone oxidoreductase subunit J [Streptomyces sp. SCSIO ZS0520]|uniref:NADH-quinone oxidoreductase subunit J family protein n=1 Tax=Streptomyces sp. SCSIO ZS0520 TaxID=2892996 RepID=UPI0021D830EB|nr:NADH-quinone oxidoreductase subunit J [Streptomyces sp. SCSIO ZS0520]